MLGVARTFKDKFATNDDIINNLKEQIDEN
jgi:hypothetical protein